MLSTIDTIRREASQRLNQQKKSELGQFMTPGIIAKFMSSLFQKEDNKSIHLLDAGAGIGSLTTAFLDRKIRGWGNSSDVQVTAYEIDQMLLGYLNANLATYKLLLRRAGINLKSHLLDVDFIKDAVSQIKSKNSKKFTHAILNPPYKKINTGSQHRQLLSSVGFETVNLYSAFVGVSLMMLEDKGELVAIIPRSFCNGNYYKAFRTLITQQASIKRIHLFESRYEAFKEDDVLQENIIIHLVKSARQGKVIISRSTDQSLNDLTEYSYPYNQIVKPRDTEAFIHIPPVGENHIEDSLTMVHTLTDIGLQVSTGPVVDFRSMDHIFMKPGKGKVPLLYPIHFNGKEIEWPKQSKKPNAIAVNPETQKMLFPSGFYTVVRRFSSKEEKQRIIARVINPNKISSKLIGIENHLNVFHFEKKGIAEDLAYGIAAYLNSTYVDTHFRSFNGHTQVNATDLRQMKYPSREVLIKLGKWAKKLPDFEPSIIDEQIRMIL